MVFYLVNGVRANYVEMICEMDFVRYVIQEIHAFMNLIRILSIILPTLTTLHTPHTRLTQVLLLAWYRVFKIKDTFGNKKYKPEDVQELFRELFNDVQNIHEELAEYINTSGWNRPAFYNNGDDDDEDCTIAITPDFLITDSLIMGDEHFDTIPEKELDEFNKSSVEDLVPNPREFEDECECDVPDCDDSQTTNFSTFSNPLFEDSTSSDDESSHEEDIHEMSFKTYSNPLFYLDEEIISSEFNLIHNEDLNSTPKNDRFDTDSYLLESSLNRDTLMISSLKIDSLLAEFASELIFLESIPPRVDEANCDPEEDIHLVERLLYDNSSPRPSKEFVFENSNAKIKSFSPSHIPVKDSDSRMEEIDLSFNSDDLMLPRFEDDDDDSERDFLIHEEFPSNYSLSLPVNESFYFDIPSFSRPPAKPPMLSSILENEKTLAKGFYPPSLHFLSFSWESSWSISITFRFSVGLQTPDDLSQSRL
nr:hypothetical protein [Tanacetum cinerariifolium]